MTFFENLALALICTFWLADKLTQIVDELRKISGALEKLAEEDHP